MEKLKRLREERGLSQVKLAARADVNPATVNQIELGRRHASPGTLRKLADALDVSLYELMEEEAPKVPAPPSPQPSFNDVLAEEWREADAVFAQKLHQQLDEQLRVLQDRKNSARSDEDLHEAARDFHHWWLFTFDVWNTVLQVHPEDRGTKLKAAVERASQAVRDEVPKDAVDPRKVPDMREIMSEWGVQQDTSGTHRKLNKTSAE